MYSFFQYTPVVNYGSKVDYTPFTHNNIRVDDGVWKDYGNKLISLDER